MKSEQLLSRVPEDFTDLRIRHPKISVSIEYHSAVRSLLHQEAILTFTFLQRRFRSLAFSNILSENQDPDHVPLGIVVGHLVRLHPAFLIVCRLVQFHDAEL